MFKVIEQYNVADMGIVGADVHEQDGFPEALSSLEEKRMEEEKRQPAVYYGINDLILFHCIPVNFKIWRNSIYFIGIKTH